MRDGLDEGALQRVGGLVAHHRLHAVRDAAHVDGGGRRALAGVHGLGLEHDVELAVLVLDDIALADTACDNLDHVVLSFSEICRMGLRAVLAAPIEEANPPGRTQCRTVNPAGSRPAAMPTAGPSCWRATGCWPPSRAWFAARDFIEVDCGALQVSPGNEAHLHGFATDLIQPDGSHRAALSPHLAGICLQEAAGGGRDAHLQPRPRLPQPRADAHPFARIHHAGMVPGAGRLRDHHRGYAGAGAAGGGDGGHAAVPVARARSRTRWPRPSG